MNKICYGRSYGKQNQCATCEIAAACAEAIDITPINKSTVKAYREMLSVMRDPDHLAVALSNMLGVVDALVALKTEHPLTYAIVRSKMDTPHASYEELARMHGLSKGSVCAHIRRAFEFVPVLEVVLLIDHRRS